MHTIDILALALAVTCLGIPAMLLAVHLWEMHQAGKDIDDERGSE